MKVRLAIAGVVVAGAVLGALHHGVGHSDPALCANGRPVPRSTHVTYGHLPACHGYVRDHIVPLCAGGLDVVANIQYQTIADGEAKDRDEWRACEDICTGRITPEMARAQFHRTRDNTPPCLPH